MAQSALPTTTKRPWLPGLPVLYVPAAASVSGPFLSFFSSKTTVDEFRLVVAKLRSEVANSFSTVDLPVDLVSSARESGKMV